jgi:hypothetical protein
MRTLIPLMLKEEFRFHASHSNKHIFLSFPVIVCLFSFATALSSSRIFEEVSQNDFLKMVHISIFLYGMSVGAFAFMGTQIVERRFGRRNFLVAMPMFLPLTFKKTFLGLYIRDVIFYVALLIIPLILGLVLSVPATNFSLVSIGFLFMAILLSFLLGMSFSFFMSSVYIRFMKLFIGLLCVIVLALIGYALGYYEIELFIPTIQFQFTREPLHFVESLALTLLLPFVATMLISEKHETTEGRFQNAITEYETKFSFFKQYSILLAKEFIDLKRSRTYAKIFFSFITPLIFLGFTSFLIRFGFNVPVSFNTIFYAAMVGFFGVLIYSWLNNVDVADYFETLPVTVPQLIKTRLIIFLILTLWISTIFVVGIGIINGDLSMLWLAIIVMFITSMYMVITIAYLTGLRTNTSLFAPDILLKFWVLALLPDVCIGLLSFTLYTNLFYSLLGIFIVCSMLILASYVLFRGLDKKWGRAEFVV